MDQSVTCSPEFRPCTGSAPQVTGGQLRGHGCGELHGPVVQDGRRPLGNSLTLGGGNVERSDAEKTGE